VKYTFDWELIGDIEAGRENLGGFVGVEVYRLMQFTLRDVMESRFGADVTDEIFYEAGHKAGMEFYKNAISPVNSLEEFVQKTQEILKERKIGILRIEEALLDEGKLVLTIDEDLDCSGLPELNFETCIYDEGFIAALIESYTKEEWHAKEIDCWCTGARTCRFMVTKKAE